MNPEQVLQYAVDKPFVWFAGLGSLLSELSAKQTCPELEDFGFGRVKGLCT
jgi:hypothetical protein